MQHLGMVGEIKIKNVTMDMKDSNPTTIRYRKILTQMYVILVSFTIFVFHESNFK